MSEKDTHAPSEMLAAADLKILKPVYIDAPVEVSQYITALEDRLAVALAELELTDKFYRDLDQVVLRTIPERVAPAVPLDDAPADGIIYGAVSEKYTTPEMRAFINSSTQVIDGMRLKTPSAATKPQLMELVDALVLVWVEGTPEERVQARRNLEAAIERFV